MQCRFLIRFSRMTYAMYLNTDYSYVMQMSQTQKLLNTFQDM